MSYLTDAQAVHRAEIMDTLAAIEAQVGRMSAEKRCNYLNSKDLGTFAHNAQWTRSNFHIWLNQGT